MTYVTGTPIKLVAGRLALEFANTADWSADGKLLKDRIETLADLRLRQAGVGLPLARWDESLGVLHAFRENVRRAILGSGVDGLAAAFGEAAQPLIPWLRQQPLRALIAVSALSIFYRPARTRPRRAVRGPRLRACFWTRRRTPAANGA